MKTRYGARAIVVLLAAHAVCSGHAQAAGGTATAENIEIVLDQSKIRIPKIELRGTTLSSADLAAIFDSGGGRPLSERLAQLAADEVSIPSMTVVDAAEGASSDTVIEDTRLLRVAHGRIGIYRTGTIRISFPRTSSSGVPTAPIFVLGMGKSETRNFDLALYARFFAEARKTADEPLASIYESGTAEGVEIRGDGFSISVAKWTFGPAKMRPLVTSIGAFAKTFPHGAKAQQTTAQAKLAATWALDLYDSVDLGTTAFQDVAGSFRGQGEAKLKVDRIELDLRKAASGEVALTGFSLVAGPNIAIAFDALRLRGLGMRGAIVAAASSDRTATVADLRDFVPSIERLLLTNLDAHLPAKRGNADEGNGSIFKIAKVDLQASNHLHGIPTTFAGSLEHLAIPLSQHDPAMRPIISLGYDAADLTYRFAYAWDQAGGTLALREMSIAGVGMGAISAKSTIGNVTKDLFVGDSAVMQAALLGVNIGELYVRVENGGLFDKLLDTQAKQSRWSVEQVRQALIAGAQSGIARLFGPSSPRAEAVSEAVVAFIRDPKSIEVVAKSAKGFGIAQLPLLQNPPELLKRLDVRATANR